jgi:hypothetical protein
MNIYFAGKGDEVLQNQTHLIGEIDKKKLIDWIDKLIQVGWWLMRKQDLKNEDK